MKRLLIAVALALTAAGCAHQSQSDPQVASAGNKTAAPSTSASADPLKFSQCMREQGLPWFPDPVDGRLSIMVPKGTDPKKMEAAQEACKQWAPDGGQPHKPSPEELQAARDMAKCMRANGVPNFPDPQSDGSIRIDGKKVGMGPGDPAFDKAQKACDKYMPKGATTGKANG